jgi:hypothetical protein
MSKVLVLVLESLLMVSETSLDGACDATLLRHVADVLHQMYNRAAERLGLAPSLVRPPMPGDPCMITLFNCLSRMSVSVEESMIACAGRKISECTFCDGIVPNGHTRLGDEHPVFDMFPMDV